MRYVTFLTATCGLLGSATCSSLVKRQTPAAEVNGIGPQTPPPGTQPVKIPQLGLGTYAINNRSIAEFAVSKAFASGFRHVDAAMIYGNEPHIGAGIARGLNENGLKREEIWITTKLWNTNHSNPEVGLKDSLERLNLTYVDLYLMHFPVGERDGKSGFDHVEVSLLSSSSLLET
jgi:diketogulonate reductase-like aldo/keto reductase